MALSSATLSQSTISDAERLGSNCAAASIAEESRDTILAAESSKPMAVMIGCLAIAES